MHSAACETDACTGDEALHTIKDLSPEQLAQLDPRAALSLYALPPSP